MAPILRRSFCILIANIFYLIMTATVFADPVEENTIVVTNEAVSPELQPLLLFYYPSRSTERFQFVLPEKRGDAVYVTVEKGSELWFMCSPEHEEYYNYSDPNITGRVILKNKPPEDPSWQLSHTRCLKKVTASTLNTNTKCMGVYAGTTGVLHKVGFWILVGHGQDESSGSSSYSYKRLDMAELKITEKKKKKTFLGIGTEEIARVKSKLFQKKESRKDLEATEFLPLYETCYDESNKIVLYTKYTAYGSSFGGKERLDSIPVLPNEEWSYERNSALPALLKRFEEEDHLLILKTADCTKQCTSIYARTQDLQFENFSSLLGTERVAHYNDRATRYLVPMQIVSPIDMVFYPWRSTLFTNLNLTSVWESILGRGWRMVEKTVNDHILSAPEYDYIIATGVSHVLTLEGRGIFLERNFETRFIRGVPRYVWKILYNWKTLEAVVFVVSNNPHLDVCEDSICPSYCGEGGYFLLPSDDPWTGCVLCCSYQEASKVLFNLPSIEGEVNPHILRFNPNN